MQATWIWALLWLVATAALCPRRVSPVGDIRGRLRVRWGVKGWSGDARLSRSQSQLNSFTPGSPGELAISLELVWANRSDILLGLLLVVVLFSTKIQGNQGKIQENQGKTLENQGKTLADLGENLTNLGKKVSEFQDSTNRSLKELIAYNRNRDSELEVLTSEAFSSALAVQGWNMSRIDVDVVYNTSGGVVTEWDGVFVGTHEAFKPTFFFIETKQIATHSKYNALLGRVDLMSHALSDMNTNRRTKNASDTYKKFVNKFKTHLIKLPEYCAKGVLASPSFPPALQETMRNDNKASFLYLSQDQYNVTVQGCEPKEESTTLTGPT